MSITILSTHKLKITKCSIVNRAFSLQDTRLLQWSKQLCTSFPFEIFKTDLCYASDFWMYFEPIRENMPANCSADVQAVIANIDQIFTGNNATAIQALKESFNLGNVSHLDDVAGARTLSIYRQ